MFNSVMFYMYLQTTFSELITDNQQVVMPFSLPCTVKNIHMYAAIDGRKQRLSVDVSREYKTLVYIIMAATMLTWPA